MRLAMRISPSRVSSSTVPISRMYMRTGIGGATELGIDRDQRGGSFLDRFLVGRAGFGEQHRLGVRCLFVHRDAHVVDHVDDVFDLLGIDDFARQVIVHLRVREVALLLAPGDQQLQLRLALIDDVSSLLIAQGWRPHMRHWGGRWQKNARVYLDRLRPTRFGLSLHFQPSRRASPRLPRAARSP